MVIEVAGVLPYVVTDAAGVLTYCYMKWHGY